MSMNPQEGSRPTVVLVHGAFADGSSWNGVIERLQAKGTGHGPRESAARNLHRLRLHRQRAQADPGPVLAVGHSYGGAVITNAATDANNVVGLVYVAAFAPDEGEPWAKSKRLQGQRPEHGPGPPPVPDRKGDETAVEFAIDPAKFHDVFAADLPAEQTAVMAATQRPVAELAFSEPNGEPAWKKLPSWAVVATADKAAGTDVVRSMAERAGAKITEVEGSHVIMMSQPQAVTDVILRALKDAE